MLGRREGCAATEFTHAQTKTVPGGFFLTYRTSRCLTFDAASSRVTVSIQVATCTGCRSTIPLIRGCEGAGGPGVPLTFLALLAAWQSLYTGHVHARWNSIHLAFTDRSARAEVDQSRQTARALASPNSEAEP
jgi:hypothetical protein